ncbi:STAS domain-containing protein [Streptomyces sp. NPDC005574]|uniref:STAS domain-containing protein n=1 Tax=Streptomyces sp. NPDC005574 TaxID=3156891 RepID=UPI0033BACDC2
MSQTRLTVSERTTPDGVRILTPAGEIDYNTADTLQQALTAHDDPDGCTVIDFHGVTFMDSSGINALVAANNAARAGNGWLRLAHTPTPIVEVLHIVGLDDVLPLYATLEDALAPQSTA